MGVKGLGARPQAPRHASHILPDFPGGTSESPGELVKRKAESRPGVADSVELGYGLGMGISNQFPGAADADRLRRWRTIVEHSTYSTAGGLVLSFRMLLEASCYRKQRWASGTSARPSLPFPVQHPD